jgi:hypothetical protein
MSLGRCFVPDAKGGLFLSRRAFEAQGINLQTVVRTDFAIRGKRTFRREQAATDGVEIDERIAIDAIEVDGASTKHYGGLSRERSTVAGLSA